mgnify:CR=1 FL=1
MPEFSFSERVPACKIDKALILTLEQYLAEELPKRFESDEKLNVQYSVSITDGVGTEVFGSFKEFIPQLLPDTTQQLSISWHNGYRCKTRVDIRVAFHGTYYLSTFSVTSKGEHAREVTLAIRDRVKKIVEPHRTLHWVFDPLAFPLLSSMAGFLAWMAAVWGIVAFQQGARDAIVLGTFSAIAGWYWVGAKLMPVISFDSRAQSRRSGVWKWLSLGFISFVLFATIATLLRRRILGF